MIRRANESAVFSTIVMTTNANDKLGRAKEYQRIKHWVSLSSIVSTLVLLILIVALHIDHSLEQLTARPNVWAQLGLYFFYFSLFFFLFDFPMSFFSGYLIEKKYALTNHTVGTWLLDQ